MRRQSDGGSQPLSVLVYLPVQTTGKGASLTTEVEEEMGVVIEGIEDVQRWGDVEGRS